jgi:hypothetical protein
MRPITKLFVICVACLGIVAFNALAEPALVVKEDLEALVFDGDGNLVFVTCAELTVVTNSKTDVINFTCRGKDVANNSGQAVIYNIYNNPFYWEDGTLIPIGFFTPDGGLVITENWKETISANGTFVFWAQAKIN